MARKRRLPERIRAHGSGFRAVVTVLGRRVYSPTFEKVAEAEAWRDSIARRKPSGAPLTLDDGLDLLLDDLRDSNAADGTRAFYDRAHLELCYVLDGATRLDQIDGAAIRLYIERRQREGVALQTIVRKELGTLRRIIRLAMATGRLGRDPMQGVKLPRVRTGRFEVVTAEQMDAALAKVRAANQDHADIIELSWRTGLRLSELARIHHEDVDLPNRRLFVRGKTNDRYRPIATALVPVLERMLARSEGKPTLVSSVKKIEKVFYFWKKKLGLQAFSTHVLRHGFVSDLLNQGAPPPVVASLVGHTSLRQLPRYYHASDPALIAAADALGQGRQRRSTPPPAGTSPDRPAPDS